MLRNSLSLLIVLCAFVLNIEAGEWPQLLGPNRNGISQETHLINGFSSEGPKIVWRAELGEGMSGIAVSGDRVCTLFQDQSHQYAVAFDKNSGEQIWKSPLAPAYENAMGNGPRSTPAIDRGQVATMTGEGIVTCLGLSAGKPLWSINVIQELGGKQAEYGMACSPVFTNKHVIVTVGLPDATVIALDRQTGQLAWKSGSGNPAGYSSPALLSIGNSVQLVAFHGSGVIGMNPETGQQIWSYPYKTDYDCNIATPIEVSGNILISSGENHGATMLTVPTQANALVKEVWTSFGNRSVLRNEWQTSIHLDGYLYAFDNIGSAGPVTNLCCINAKTGEQVWQKRRFGKGNLIAADGKLWCSTMEGELVIVKATPESFKELGRISLVGKTRQAPALSEGFLFLSDGAELVCVDIRK